MKLYTNFTIFTGNDTLHDHAVLVNDEAIVAILPTASFEGNYEIIDGKGKNLAPAFIDAQIYGAHNLLFADHPTEEAIKACYNYCLQGGAANFLLTIATNSWAVVDQCIAAAQRYLADGGKGLLGLHLEGPFISPIKRGAHLSQFIEVPTVAKVEALLQKANGLVRMMTIAPEVCSQEVMDLLLRHNIVLSAGHSNATYAEAMDAFDRGVTAATHLFNVMSPLQHREPGLVGAIFQHGGVCASIIPDGIHVSWPAVQIAKKQMQERLFIITDAVTNATGAYPHVFAKDRYTLPDGMLSGSALNMLQAVQNMVQHAHVSLAEALRMGSLYPAKLLGLDDRLGKIEKGYAAEFVIF